MTNLMDRESVNRVGNLYKLPDFEEVDCEQQKNSFDCGPFIIGYMADAIERIKGEDVPRYLKAPTCGALVMRERFAKYIDENISKIPKSKEKSKSTNDKPEEKDNIEIIKIINDKTCKSISEKKENSEEKKNNKTTDKDKEKNIKEALKILNEMIYEDGDTDKQKTNENGSIGIMGSKDTYKDTNKTKDQIENSKDNKKEQEEIKTMHKNNTKDSRERDTRNLSSKTSGRECRYYVNDSCKYGRLCRYTHREVCSSWKRNGKCGNGKCTFSHPEPCLNHLKGVCQRRNCWFLSKISDFVNH